MSRWVSGECDELRLEREEFGRSMASLFWRESQRSAPNERDPKSSELSLRVARQLLIRLGVTCYVDFFGQNNKLEWRSGWLASLLQPRWLAAAGEARARCGSLLAADLMKYFYIYYALINSSLVLGLQWNYDMKWHRLRELLGRCAGSLEQLSKLEFPLDAGLLLLNGDPTRNSLLLYSSLQPNSSSSPLPALQLASNQFVCRPSLSGGAANATTNQQVLLQQLDLKRARQLIKLVGNSYLNHNFPFECTLLFMLIFIVVCYFMPLVLYYHGVSLDFGLMRAMLGLQAEFRASFELVREQVNLFIKSSAHFATISRRQVSAAWELQAVQLELERAQSGRARELGSGQRPPLVHQLEHRQSVRQAKQLALSGALQPINLFREQLVSSATLFSSINVLLSSGATLLGLFVAQALPRLELLSSLPLYLIEYEPRDVLFSLEMTIYFGLSPHIAMFYITYAAVNCIDQLYYASDLRSRFQRCRFNTLQLIQLDRSRAARIVASNRLLPGASEHFCISFFDNGQRAAATKHEQRHQHELWRHHHHQQQPQLEGEHEQADESQELDSEAQPKALVERQMLELLLRYKIFVKQFQPVRRSLGLLSLGALLILVVPPLIANFYYAYLDAGCRNLIAAFSILFSLAADILFLPICRLHCSCQDIYRELCKLLARSVQLSSVDKTLANRWLVTQDDSEQSAERLARARLGSLSSEFELQNHVYDNHILWLLRKELGHPELMLKSFAVSIGSMQICYENLIKIHFWLGFVLLPTVLFDANSMGRRGLFSIIA